MVPEVHVAVQCVSYSRVTWGSVLRERGQRWLVPDLLLARWHEWPGGQDSAWVTGGSGHRGVVFLTFETLVW